MWVVSSCLPGILLIPCFGFAMSSAGAELRLQGAPSPWEWIPPLSESVTQPVSKQAERLETWERNLLPKHSPVICSLAAGILQMLQQLSNSTVIYTAPTQTLPLDKNNLHGELFLPPVASRTCEFPWLIFVQFFETCCCFFCLIPLLFIYICSAQNQYTVPALVRYHTLLFKEKTPFGVYLTKLLSLQALILVNTHKVWRCVLWLEDIWVLLKISEQFCGWRQLSKIIPFFANI